MQSERIAEWPQDGVSVTECRSTCCPVRRIGMAASITTPSVTAFDEPEFRSTRVQSRSPRP